MATDRIKYSEAIQSAAALTLNNNDVIALAQEDSQQETGYVSKATRMTTLGEKIVNGIDYTTELETNSKKIIGAINELKRTGGSTDIIGTASGDILTFTDGGDNIPVKSLVTEIVAVQAGTGTPSPSNVRSISGFDEVEVVVTGKNLCPYIEYGQISQTTGEEIVSSSSKRSGFIKVEEGETYTISHMNSPQTTIAVRVFFYENKTTFIDNSLYQGVDPENFTLTIPNGVGFIRFQTSGVNITYDNVMAEHSNTATVYEPYNGTTHTITLPETIYGGTAELVGGNGTKTHGYIELDGTEATISRLKAHTFLVRDAKFNDTPAITTSGVDAICSHFTRQYPVQYSTLADGQYLFNASTVSSTQKGFVCRIDSISDTVEAFTTWLTSNHIGICFPLDEPTPFTTTPEEITTLSGVNNIYSNTGDVEVEYFNENADQMAELIKVLTR